MVPQTLKQQDKAAQTIAACAAGKWLRIVVNYEVLEDGNDLCQYRDSALALYLRPGSPRSPRAADASEIETVDLRLSHAAVDELLALRDLLPSPQGIKWSTCDLVIEGTGEYKFHFSYDPPKRLNGIFDDESYERFRNYAETYKRERRGS